MRLHLPGGIGLLMGAMELTIIIEVMQLFDDSFL
jgi:hypothetical protein